MTKFTAEMVDVIVGEYEAVREADYAERTAVVKDLADRFDLAEASVRAKLVSEGVYVRKEAEKGEKGKAGTSKAEIVKAFEAVTGEKLASMEKMTKKDLQTLWDWVVLTSARREADGE